MTINSTSEIRFPDDPVLVRLLEAARQISSTKTIIFDELGFEKTYSCLLGDIVQTRNLLAPHISKQGESPNYDTNENENYVAVLSRSGYEFLIAFFAIRAAGGVCVPIGSGVLPEEGHYMLEKAKANILLLGKNCLKSGEAISDYFRTQGQSQELTLLPIDSDANPISNSCVTIDDAIPVDTAGPGMVLFTSGTTGRPKGVVLPRICFADLQAVEKGKGVLNHRPGNWIGGARNLIEPVVSGKVLVSIGEKKGQPRAEAVLAALAKHDITDVFFTPALLRWMKLLLTSEEGSLTSDAISDYARAFRHLSSIKCTGGVCEPSTIDFWTSSTGLPFESTYAGTEMGGVAFRGCSKIKGSIGRPLPGIKVKLSNGSQGEILVKSPRMLLGYISDKEASRNAFDEEGYYKTGDLAEYKDGEYVFAGRANADFVLYQNYRFSTITVESSILDLPYFDEASVVAVPDLLSRQLCGLIARPSSQYATREKQIDLAQVRQDLLRQGMTIHMLPILFRILGDDEVLPRSTSGKPMKRQILEQYFGSISGLPPSQLPSNVERLNLPKISSTNIQPWDWCGMQSAD